MSPTQEHRRHLPHGIWALAALWALLTTTGCVLPHRTEATFSPLSEAKSEDSPPIAPPPPSSTQESSEPTKAPNGGDSFGPSPSELAQFSAQRGTLGPGDVLDIRIFEEPDLTGTYRISEAGHIDFPFCGRILVNGLTQGSLADKITSCLKSGYLKNPQVTLFLKESNSRKIFVLGQVNKPGTFPFEGRMTVVQAVSLAGGFGKLASKNAVIVTRRTPQGEQKFKVPVENIAEGRHANFTLQPGDIVYVPESFL